jgi:hypothetical protein
MRGHRVSARDGFLRAATYHRTSEFFLHGNPKDARIYNAYQKSIKCYKSCCALYDPPIVPVRFLMGERRSLDIFIGWMIQRTGVPFSSSIQGLMVLLRSCILKGLGLPSNVATTY